MGYQIEDFKDPLIHKLQVKKGRKEELTFKTFSKEFLLFLMQSELFKRDFLDFITGPVKQFYMQKVPKKLNSIRAFICKMDSMMGGGYSVNIYHNTESYFWRNKQCKLPWSFAEIDDAVSSILNRLD